MQPQQTPIMKGRRCRKTFKRCLDKGNHYCVTKKNKNAVKKHKSIKRKRCRRGSRRCIDGICHKVSADTIPFNL